jgi:hypothetical protein
MSETQNIRKSRYFPPQVSAAGWQAANFPTLESITYRLTDTDLADLDRAIGPMLDAGVKYQATSKADFRLDGFSAALDAMTHEVSDGRGFALIRGLPVLDRGKEWGRMAAWAIGTYFGTAVSQTRDGTMMADVMDVTKGQSGPRGYNSNAELRLHTDPASDLIALCCLEAAKSGGESILASSVSVYNEIAAKRPDLLEPLYEGFFYHRFSEGPVDAGPISEVRVPIFTSDGNEVLCRYGRQRIKAAHDELGLPLSATEIESLDFFNEVANSDDLSLHFKLQPGDFLVANNLKTLHARTNFEDNEDPARPRHLLRLWLASEQTGARALNFLNHGECGIPKRDAAA